MGTKAKLTIPKEVTKNKREHVLPISDQTVALVDQLLAYGDKPFANWGKEKDRLDAILGDRVGPWVLRDLRRTYATKNAELGTPPHVVERLLNHVTGSLSPISLVYNRATYQKEMREAVERYERWLCDILARVAV